MLKRWFWKAPSGKVHSDPYCVFGPGPSILRALKLSRREFEASMRCSCAEWSKTA